MTAIAFIGLGIMGKPMALNLLAQGHDVVGINRSPRAVEEFVQAGGRTMHLADAIAEAQVIITMLPDTPDLEQVMQQVFIHAAPSTLIIDCSTISPAATRVLAAQAAEHSLSLVDAPVSGGEPGAIEGTLSILVGGDSAAVESARPILEALGSTIVHVGASGSGQIVKAANQLVVAGTIEVVAEAMVFLEAQGVDLDRAVTVLAGGLAGSQVIDRKSAAMIEREFDPGFRIALHQKDLGIFSAAAREAGVVTPVGALVTQLMAAAVANGDGGLDHSALLRGVERLSGRS